jgi:hypothetical protein
MNTEEKSTVTVMNTGIRYGALLGLILIAYFVVLVTIGADTTQGFGRWSGLLLNAGILVLAHLYFREQGDGYMSYAQGLGIGFFTGLFSGVMYSAFFLVFVTYIDLDFMQLLQDAQRQAMEESGAREEQIEQGMKMAARFSTPGFLFLFSVIGTVILQMAVALAVSVFTQRPDNRMPSA